MFQIDSKECDNASNPEDTVKDLGIETDKLGSNMTYEGRSFFPDTEYFFLLSQTVPHEFNSEPVPEVEGIAIILGMSFKSNSLLRIKLFLKYFISLLFALKAITALVKSITLPPPKHII